MAVPAITALKMWVGSILTKDDWNFNFNQIVEWLSGGSSDLIVNSIKTENGLDLDGSKISNVGVAVSGTDAINLDQAETLLNRAGAYYPFSVASGKVDSNGESDYLSVSNDEITVLAGGVNPDLVCIQSDGTIESVTSNTILTKPGSDGTYNIIKEKGQAITLTAGSITQGREKPASPSIGDYYCDDSVVPFKGWKCKTAGWDEEQEFCYLGTVTVSSGVATVKTVRYNNNGFDVNKQSTSLLTFDLDNKIQVSSGQVSTEQSYTCPDDGYILYKNVLGSASTDNGYIALNGENVVFMKASATSYASSGNGSFLVNKGDVITYKLPYSGNTSDSTIDFVPMKGLL